MNKLSVPQDVIRTGSYPSGASAGSALLNMPAGGAGVNAWLVSCAGLAPKSLGNTGSGGQWSLVGQYWCEGLFGSTVGNVIAPPNSNYPYCAIYSYGGDNDGSYGSFGLSSYHSGGANVCMADGSVKFLKATINQVTLWGLGSRNQGEVIGADTY